MLLFAAAFLLGKPHNIVWIREQNLIGCSSWLSVCPRISLKSFCHCRVNGARQELLIDWPSLIPAYPITPQIHMRVMTSMHPVLLRICVRWLLLNLHYIHGLSWWVHAMVVSCWAQGSTLMSAVFCFCLSFSGSSCDILQESGRPCQSIKQVHRSLFEFLRAWLPFALNPVGACPLRLLTA